MKGFLLTLWLIGIANTANAAIAPAEIIPAQGGAIRITPMFHGSLQIEYRGEIIHVDPFSAGDYSGAKKADFVLITHTHPDHLDAKAISQVTTNATDFIAPSSVSAALKKIPFVQKGHVQILKNGELTSMKIETELDENGKKRLLTKMTFQAVPMYNLKRGPKPGQKFHPKGQFNGYVLTLGGKRIYIAGDTEATPEMKALKNIDVAFLPMNLPYTMTPQEAAVGAKAFKPKVVYPYHYRYPFTKPNNNPQQFAKAMAGSGVTVKIRNWYANPAK